MARGQNGAPFCHEKVSRQLPAADAPDIDPDWGEPGLTPVERVFAWNTIEVLAFTAGNLTQLGWVWWSARPWLREQDGIGF